MKNILIVLLLLVGCSEAPFSPTEPVQSDREVIDSLTAELAIIRLGRGRYRCMARCYANWFEENGIEKPQDCIGGI